MIVVVLPVTATIDPLEARLIRCLQLAPRLPFAVASPLLGVSEQTVARRYRTLVKDGVVRVAAVIRPAALGQSNWNVRIQCKPSGSVALARALAQRDDISWVTLVSGGSEVVCVLRSRTDEARDELLMQRLPRTAPVLGMSASMVLHRFIGAEDGPLLDWSALGDVLTHDEQSAVLEYAEPIMSVASAELTLQPADVAMLDALNRDGRTSYASLAAIAGTTQTRAARRLRTLWEQGVAYYDVDLSVAALGLRSMATLWLTVTPSELQRAGDALARTREAAFAAAITGPQNLTASVVCRDVDALYGFVTDEVGAIPGVQTMEIAPVLRHVKQAGALTDGERLALT